MQQGIVRRDVYQLSMSARIGGRDVEVAGVKSERELPDPLVGGGLRAATVNLEAVEGTDVTSTVATPWDVGSQWPPVPEAPASVEMDTGAGPVSVLRDGRVVEVEGGTSDRAIGVELADAYQTLDRKISWDGLGDSMPALTEATDQRYVSLRASAVTDMILRHCGWYCTPPLLPYPVLSVPAMGTMWPERGRVDSSGRQSDGGGYPPMATDLWGVSVTDTDSRYTLAGAGYTIKDRGRIELVVVAGRLTGAAGSLTAGTDSAGIRLSWNDTTGYVQVTGTDGQWKVAASVPRDRVSLLYVTVEYVSDSSVRVILRADSESVTATTTVRSAVTTSVFTEGRILTAAGGGGFQIAYPALSGTLTTWTPNAVIYDRFAGPNTIKVLPPMEGENCADLLAEQCAAQNATYWIDETGVLRWWDLERLEAQESVATLHSDDDIDGAGFSWTHSLSQVKSRVSVKWREPVIQGGWRTNVDLWQGGGGSVETTTANTPHEEWINVPDDEVWIMPDLYPSRVGGAGAHTDDFNHGIRSHYGGIVRLAGGEESWVQNHGSFLVRIERVTDSTFKMSTTWTGSEQAYQRTPQGSDSVVIWRFRRDFNLPIIRGKKKYMLADRTIVSTQSGPPTAPEHSIDAGWWIQSEEQAQRTADYAGARLTIPQPVLSSVALIPVPGLQLGDVVEVRDTAVTRLTVRGIVVADSRSIRSDMDMAHAVAIRPTYVTRNGVTWEEWGQAVRGSTWDGWQDRQDGTWQQWGANPLKNEEVL